MPPNATSQQYALTAAQRSAPAPAQTIDFRRYVDKVDKVYDKYSSSSCSKEYDNAFDAVDDIDKIVKTIRKVADKVSFAGKQDAISAIIDIALAVVATEGSKLASQIRKNSGMIDFAAAIIGIVDQCSADEIDILQRGEELAQELHELADNADRYCLDLELGPCLERIGGALYMTDESDSEDHET